MNTRQLAVDVLVKMEQQQAYSNLLLRQTLEKQSLSGADTALLTEIVYGTTLRLNTIDLFLQTLIARDMDKFSPWLRACLRMSMYQLLYLEKIPDYAVVNIAVNIAKKRGHLGIAKLVNGVLRNAIRTKAEFFQTSYADEDTRLAIRYSCPEWLVQLWRTQYGADLTEEMCKSLLNSPNAAIRVNTLRISRDQLLAQLQENGKTARPSTFVPDGIILEKPGNLSANSLFKQGFFSIQDESSMAVAHMTEPEPGMRVLDCCAAPGGKATHLAQLMDDRGQVIANDVHPHKQALIAEQAARLHLSSVQTMTEDAGRLARHFSEASFHRVLLDAPCSGFGVIRRKPDLKWKKTTADLQAIVTIQKRLLDAVAPLVKPGGLLVYSTCTMNKQENELVVQDFVRRFPQFQFETKCPPSLPEDGLAALEISPGMYQIFPQTFHSDGFFIARLRRL